MESTNLNNTQQNNLKELKPHHQLAVDLRVNGCSYQEIALDSRVNSKEQTVRSWFMLSGICHEAYEYKNRLLGEDRWAKMKQVEAGIQDLASGALEVLKEEIAQHNLKAAIRVLEMAGFKEIQRVEEIQPQHDEAITLLRQIIEDRRETARLNRLSSNTSE
jgi:hypothetical protein